MRDGESSQGARPNAPDAVASESVRRIGLRSRRGRLLALITAIAALLVFAGSALAAAPKWELITNHGPTNVPRTPLQNEVVLLTVKAVKGHFTLDLESEEASFWEELLAENHETEETKPIKFNATAAEVKEKIERIVGAGNVAVTGGPGDETGSTPYRIEFTGALGGRSVQVEAEGELFLPAPEPEKPGELEEEGEAVATVATPGSHDTVVFQVLPRNVSSTPTAGLVTVTDKLPNGFTTKEAPEAGGWTCTPMTPGHTTITCTTETPVPPDSQAPAINIEAYADVNALSEGEQVVNAPEVSGGGAATPAKGEDVATVSATPASFGVRGFSAGAFNASGETDTRAGGHPYAATTSFFFNTVPFFNSQEQSTQVGVPGQVKDADVKLPEGFIGNPQAVARCSQSEFTEGLRGGPVQGGGCKTESQVGTVQVYFGTFGKKGETRPLFNLEPPAGVPAEFGFVISSGVVPIRLDAHVIREHGKYQVTVLSPDINEVYNVYGLSLTLWGVPAEASHDADRVGYEPGFNQGEKKEVFGVPDPEPAKPFLTNPADCVTEAEEVARGRKGPTTALFVDRWEEPGPLTPQGNPVFESPQWLQSAYESPPVQGCDQLSFHPSIGFEPASREGFKAVPREGFEEVQTEVDQPSGFKFELGIPQDESPEGRATPQLKDTTVTLPEGVTISPSGANGLAACSAEQINLESTERGTCPTQSQIGEVTVKTPLLGEPLGGRVYIATPECSPCSAEDDASGRLFRLYIEAEGSGVRVKLPGTAITNPVTGQITTTFKENPQLPFETLTLTLKGGPGAPLATPQVCGSVAASATLSSWSLSGSVGEVPIPGTGIVEAGAHPFGVDYGAGDSPCPGSFPLAPALEAGTSNSAAGQHTNFAVTFKRQDHEQDLSGITVKTPPGLLGTIKGISRCSNAQAEAKSCPAPSQIGTATSAAGAGPTPYVVSGPVYLTEGYKGAPFGLAIVVPAVAGPFNLGTVGVRAAIRIDPVTSALTVTSDALPQSIDGVPFRLKEVRVEVNRANFMFNPTNCSTQNIEAMVTGQPLKAGEGAVTTPWLKAPFTASNCAALSFKPTFTATTQAKTSKANGASLLVTVAQKEGEAHIQKVELQLPMALPSRLTTLQKACTEAQFNANPAGCPEASNVGHAKAITPLLTAPLEGPAYLVSHGGAAFPDLVFLLQGEGVSIELTGHTDVKKGITYSRFETVPDAPITSFETDFPQGPHSVLAANGNLCEQSLIAPTTIVGQNNAQVVQKTKLAVLGCTPSVSVAKAKVKGNALLLTLKLGMAGTVKVVGAGLKSTSKRLGAGSRQIKVPLSKAGRKARKHHKKLKFRASLTAAGKTATKTASVRA